MNYYIYILIALFLFILSVRYDFRIKESKRSTRFYNFMLVVFILVAGLRWKVGGDSITYQSVFEDYIPTLPELLSTNGFVFRWEPLFILLMSACKTITNDFLLFQIIHAVFINFVIFRFIARFTSFRFFALLIYGIFFYWYFNMEILRESIAICLFLLAYPSYQKSRWGRYYLYVFIAIFFHNSAAVLLFFPFFRNIRMDNKWIIKLSAFVVLMIAFLSYAPVLFGDIGFLNRLFVRYELYSTFNTNVFGKIYSFTFFMFLPYLVYYFNSKYIKSGMFEDLFFNYFLVAALTILFSGFSRFINYFIPFMAVYAAMIIGCLISRYRFRQIKYIMLFLIVVPSLYHKISYYSYSTVQAYPDTRRVNAWYPYASVLDKQEYPFREPVYFFLLGKE